MWDIPELYEEMPTGSYLDYQNDQFFSIVDVLVHQAKRSGEDCVQIPLAQEFGIHPDISEFDVESIMHQLTKHGNLVFEDLRVKDPRVIHIQWL